MLVRAATSDDLPTLGRLGALLMRVHYDFDQLRFIDPGAEPERGYARFLGAQLRAANSAVLVAEVDGRVGGYVYVAIEPLSWKELRDECGYIHDLVVDPEERGHGAGTALLEAACEWLRSRGMSRVVLGTAEKNVAAQRLFERRQFRRTMIELTREL